LLLRGNKKAMQPICCSAGGLLLKKRVEGSVRTNYCRN
jgi:hypothetical protein